MSVKSNADLIAGLRAFADHLDGHPELPLVCGEYFALNFATMEESPEAAAEIARVFAPIRKNYGTELVSLSREFGPLEVKWVFWRKTVCRKVVTGKKLVEAQVIPARPEEVIPEHEEETFEWDCGPILAPDSPDSP